MVFPSFSLATASNRLRDLVLLAQRHAMSALPGVRLESQRLRRHEPG